MKILTVVGARPQFIKAASVSRAIAEENRQGANIQEVIVHTGQHYDQNMSDVFFNEMKIPAPDYQLHSGGGNHGEMTGKMIHGIEDIILKEMPDWMLLYGDTNSTLAGAIAASKHNIKIAHIEAGLRSFNNNMPEEINRILTDRVSSILFCPTEKSIDNLNAEGVLSWGAEVNLVGDVMEDGAKFYSSLAKQPSSLTQKNPFVLCTIHRAENTDFPNRLNSIILALIELSNSIDVILPLHPRTKKIIQETGIKLEGLKIVDPVGYLEMIWLIKSSELVMTDSGGLQKEAFFFKKPCITLRDETEWVELVDNGFNKLVGSDYNKIINAFYSNDFNSDYDLNLYGQGEASKKIVRSLIKGGKQ